MPADVISTLGRKRVVSLKTSDYSTALRLHSVESEKFAKDVNRARGLSSSPTKEPIEPLDTAEAYRLVQRYFEERRSQIGAVGIGRATLLLAPRTAGEQDHIDIQAELDAELIGMLDPKTRTDRGACRTLLGRSLNRAGYDDRSQVHSRESLPSRSGRP